ncbi:hypothetical protein BDV93DRAFT_511337 [Ceratobasidium sp. AG-I]|nr:hypothetical protein BDV93DRAFT_513032 [Ceratobasidium sp. AG-I]KAF8599797.1 hypothetical protein BDV93DRAFT_511337 [Ceratobasidium sp. AG-I]
MSSSKRKYVAEGVVFDHETPPKRGQHDDLPVRMISEFTLKRGRNLLILPHSFAAPRYYTGVRLIGKVTSLAKAAGPAAETGFWEIECEPVQFAQMELSIRSLRVEKSPHFRDGTQSAIWATTTRYHYVLGQPSEEYQYIWQDACLANSYPIFHDWDASAGRPPWWPSHIADRFEEFSIHMASEAGNKALEDTEVTELGLPPPVEEYVYSGFGVTGEEVINAAPVTDSAHSSLILLDAVGQDDAAVTIEKNVYEDAIPVRANVKTSAASQQERPTHKATPDDYSEDKTGGAGKDAEGGRLDPSTGPQTRGSARKRSAEADLTSPTNRIGVPPGESAKSDMLLQVMARDWAGVFLAEDRFQTLEDCDVLAEVDLSDEFPVREGQTSEKRIYGHWLVQYSQHLKKGCEAYVENTHWSLWKAAEGVRSMLDSSLYRSSNELAAVYNTPVMRTSLWRLYVGALTLPHDVRGPLQRRFLAVVAIHLRDGRIDDEGLAIWYQIQMAENAWRLQQSNADCSALPDFSFLQFQELTLST